ncbi:MAG: hypothetical protein R3B68_07625 [Phycisphaerales bacterium]
MTPRPGPMTPARLPLAALCALALALSGCSTSIWQRAYRPSPLSADAPLAGTAETGASSAAADPSYPSNHPVVVRQAPWERVEAALDELEAREVASDVHTSEWSLSEKAAATDQLLSALQLQESAGSATIVGMSSFATTEPIRPGSGELARQARSVGADYAIWSSRYLGRGTRVVDRPVTVHRHGWGEYYDRHDGRWRSRYHSTVDTAWVPVVVEADRVAYVAFFIRKSPLVDHGADR